MMLRDGGPANKAPISQKDGRAELLAIKKCRNSPSDPVVSDSTLTAKGMGSISG